ncbi:quinone oxidoreductase [Bacillus sp. Leaf406]|nr:quinone oxidoreductase [Bacillus sp. Leaf406]
MRAVVVKEYGDVTGMYVEEVDRPVPGAGEVLVRVVKTSVNFADIKARRGGKGNKLPFIPGLDAAGIVEEIGEGCRNVSVGQRVICFPDNGSYAEYVIAREVLVVPIPDEMNMTVAAASPVVSFLSHRLLTDVARMKKGESVLIHAAAGGVGTTAASLAKQLGAGLVIGTVGSEGKAQVARKAGVDEIILYKEIDFARRVNELTNGEGVDIVLDSISGEVTERSLTCLAPYGRLVHFGNAGGPPGNIQTIDLHSTCRSILGFSLGTTRKKRPETLQETAEAVIPMLTSGRLTVDVGHEFSLDEIRETHVLMENRGSKGKIVIRIGEE